MNPPSQARHAPAQDALELRVLSGLHNQASCLAEDGAVLGSDPACDVVLADTGLGARAARLRIGPQGWDLAPDQDTPAGQTEPATPFNQPMPLGPVWVTVARRADPWMAGPVAANDGDAGASAVVTAAAVAAKTALATVSRPVPARKPAASATTRPRLSLDRRRRRDWFIG